MTRHEYEMSGYHEYEMGGSHEYEFGGIFDSIGKGIKKVAGGVAKGAAGVGKGAVGMAGAIFTANPKKAVKNAKSVGKSAAGAVSAVTSNRLIQAVWPGTIIPGIAAGAARGGVKGASAAAKQVAKNPAVKAELMAAGLVFPPVAPFSGAAIAATEAAARVHDGLKSKDPSKIAAAVAQVAGTTLLAQQGHPDAKRAVDALKKVGASQKFAEAFMAGVPSAKAALASAKSKGTAKAKQGISLVQHMVTREAMKLQGHPDPKKRKLANEIFTKLQIEAPNLVQAVKTALTSPKGLKVGPHFAVIRTGRILRDGKPIRGGSKKSASSARAHGVRR